MIVDRYHLHRLGANPFAVTEQQSHTDDVFVDRGLPDPPPPGSCSLVQVIGDKGAGKSTQVRAWQRLVAGPYHYVPSRPYRSRWVRPPVERVVYGDEIDRMPAPLRRRWFRGLADARATVVVGTHQDLAALAHGAGLQVVTHQLGPANLATVRAVLVARIAHVATPGPGPVFRLSETEIADVHRQSQGSLRAAEVLAHTLVAQRVQETSTAMKVSPP